MVNQLRDLHFEGIKLPNNYQYCCYFDSLFLHFLDCMAHQVPATAAIGSTLFTYQRPLNTFYIYSHRCRRPHAAAGLDEKRGPVSPIRVDAIDFDALRKWTVLDSGPALKFASAGRASAGVQLGSAKPNRQSHRICRILHHSKVALRLQCRRRKRSGGSPVAVEALTPAFADSPKPSIAR